MNNRKIAEFFSPVSGTMRIIRRGDQDYLLERCSGVDLLGKSNWERPMRTNLGNLKYIKDDETGGVKQWLIRDYYDGVVDGMADLIRNQKREIGRLKRALNKARTDA